MVDKTELRIGNWVKCYLDVPMQISELGNDSYLSGSFFAYKTSNPIPLTPEILEGCGFERWHFIKREFYYKGEQVNKVYKIIQPADDTYDYLFVAWYWEAGLSLKYLHQLQNLYFALTGQELKVNVPVGV